ncbi:MAG: HEAT repeat domain-containing protein [Pseudanabaenaceae cyanobacterium]
MAETASDWTPATAIARLRSPDLSERYYAAWWLGKMRIHSALPHLLVALQDEDDRTELGGYPLRRNAARALGKLGDPEALPALQSALACADIYVREAVAQAIAEIAKSSPTAYQLAQECVPALCRLLQSSDPQPYEAILETLGTLKALSGQALIEPFLQHPLPRIRMAAARAMYGLTADPQYAELLVQELHHPNVNLRRVALTDLGQIGYLPAFRQIAACPVENSFKLLALKNILEHHLPPGGIALELDPSLAQTLQEVMLVMDELL